MPTSSSQLASKAGRNDRCECGSGKKVKACCGEKKQSNLAAPKAMTDANVELLFPSHSTVYEYIKNVEAKTKKLAMKLYNEPESNIKIITRNDDVSGKMFRSYVQLNKPGKQPMLKCSTAALQKTPQESLEALMMTLRQAVEEEAMRSAQETFDKTFGAEATEGVAGENSGS